MILLVGYSQKSEKLNQNNQMIKEAVFLLNLKYCTDYVIYDTCLAIFHDFLRTLGQYNIDIDNWLRSAQSK